MSKFSLFITCKKVRLHFVTILILLPGSLAAQTNVINNGGFEQATYIDDTQAQEWVVQPVGGQFEAYAKTTTNGIVPPEGTKMMYAKCLQSSSYAFQMIYKPQSGNGITLKSGSNYILTFKAYSVPGTVGVVPQMAIKAQAPNPYWNIYIADTYFSVPGGSWQTFRYTFTATSSASAGTSIGLILGILLSGNAVNTIFYFDDFKIVEDIKVTTIALTGSDIIANDATSTVSATVSPANAADQSFTWSVSDLGIATISSAGVVIPKKNGTVVVTATSNEIGSTVTGTKTITISNQVDNKVLNGGFEQAIYVDGTQPQEWLLDSGGGETSGTRTTTINGVVPPEGTHMFHVNCLSTTSYIYQTVFKPTSGNGVSLKSGSNYILTFQVYSVPGTNGVIPTMAINLYSVAPYFHSYKDGTSFFNVPGGSWQTVSYPFTVTSSAADGTNVNFVLGACLKGNVANTNFYFDNFNISYAPVIFNLTGAKTDTDISNYCSTPADVNVSGSGSLFTVNNALAINSLTLSSGAQATVSKPLTVSSDLSVSADSKMVLTDALSVGGNLILKGTQTTTSSIKVGYPMTVTGSIKFLKTIDNVKWYFMSMPSDVTVSQITKSDGSSLGTLGTNWFIKKYDGSHRSTNGAVSNWVDVTSGETLTAKKGYIFGLQDLTGPFEILFPLDKTVLVSEAAQRTIAVNAYASGTAGAANLGWNLVGQPYLSNYASQTGANVLNMYVYNGSTYDSYAQNTLDLPTISPFSAYFTQVTSGLETSGLTFGLAARQAAPASVKAIQTDLIRMNITTSTGTDKTNLILDDQESTAYQIGSDLSKMLTTGTDTPQLYTITDGVYYANNALPADAVLNMPLGVYTKTASSAIIHVDASFAAGVQQFILTDQIAGVSTDLLQSDYVFTTTAGTINNRFLISVNRVVTRSSTIHSERKLNIRITNDKLVISELKENSIVKLFDSLGHLILTQKPTGSVMEIKLANKGIYTLSVLEGQNQSVTKCICF